MFTQHTAARANRQENKGVSTSYDKEASLEGLLRHQWDVFPAGGQEAERQCLGSSWCLKDRSLEGPPHKGLPGEYRVAVPEFPAREPRKAILICDGPNLKREKCEG